MLPKVILNTDGGSRRNPGPAGIGAVLTDADGQILAQLSEYIGTATNNEAEYQALIQGLEMCRRTVEAKKVYLLVRLDSELVARQVEGIYKVREEHLKPLVQQVRALLTSFAAWRVESVPRERNKLADQLVNQAVNRELGRAATAIVAAAASPMAGTGVAETAVPMKEDRTMGADHDPNTSSGQSQDAARGPDPTRRAAGRKKKADPGAGGQLSFEDLGLLKGTPDDSANAEHPTRAKVHRK